MFSKQFRSRTRMSSFGSPLYPRNTVFPQNVPRSRLPRLKLQRALVEISPRVIAPEEREVTLGSFLLSDISRAGLLIFSTRPLVEGTRVDVNVEQPTAFFGHGRVLFCNEMVRNTRVISEYNWIYRMGIVFDFQSPDEKLFLERYLEAVAKFEP
jgi:hypothetical protein